MREKSQNRLHRKRNIRKPYKVIYIFTEGEKTEPNYFKSKKKEIRKTNIHVEITGTGRNTLDLVEYVLGIIKKKGINTDSYECWVVFDKDDFDEHFDNAINKALGKGLNVAYSNESFELWLLLHFDLLTSAIGRKDYINKLTDNLKKLTKNNKAKYRR